MVSCADRFWILLLASCVWGARPAWAQEGVPPDVRTAIAAEASRLYGYLPDSLVLIFGAMRGTPIDGTCCESVRLVAGRDGWHTALLRGDRTHQTYAARVRIGMKDLVPVAARTLAAGDTLRPEHVEYRSETIWLPRRDERYANPGWIVRSRLSAGDPLRHPWLVPPPLIDAGRNVVVVIRRGVVRVEASGHALGDAGWGERVQVRLAHGRGIVEGTAVARDTVLIQN